LEEEEEGAKETVRDSEREREREIKSTHQREHELLAPFFSSAAAAFLKGRSPGDELRTCAPEERMSAYGAGWSSKGTWELYKSYHQL
jgi:hypothetical protein